MASLVSLEFDGCAELSDTVPFYDKLFDILFALRIVADDAKRCALASYSKILLKFERSMGLSHSAQAHESVGPSD